MKYLSSITVVLVVLTVALVIRPLYAVPAGDEHTTFSAGFEGSATADSAQGSPYAADSVSAFPPGRQGQALLAQTTILPFAQSISPLFIGLKYETEGNINLAQGTIEMWVQPTFNTGTPDEDSPRQRYLISSNRIALDGKHMFCLFFMRAEKPGSPYRLIWLRQNGDVKAKTWTIAVAPGWSAGEWHHVAVTYSATQDELYIDGKRVGKVNTGESMDSLDMYFTVGANVYNGSIAGSLIDELRLSDVVRYTGDFAVR